MDIGIQKVVQFVKKKFVKETIWSFLTKGVTFVLFYAINIYLSRVLGVNKFGQWSFFFSTLTIMQIISHFGVNGSSRKYIAQFNHTDRINSVLLSSIQLRVIISLCFGILILIFHNRIADMMGENITRLMILITVPYIIFAGFVEFLKQSFVGLHRIKFNFVINLLEYGLKLGLLIASYYLTRDLEIQSILNIYLLALVITVFVGLGIILYKYMKAKQKKFINGKLLRKIFSYSLPLFVISIGFVIKSEISTVMLGFYHSDAEVGVYSVASQITNKLPQIAFAITMGTMPIFAKLNQDNRTELESLFLRLLKINAVIFGVIIAFILLFSSFFIPIIFGEEYIPSVVPLKLLMPFVLVFSFNNFFTSFLDYQGLAARRAIYLLMSSGLHIVLNFFLIPKYGSVGAAVSNSVSYLPYLVLNALEVQRTFTLIRKEN